MAEIDEDKIVHESRDSQIVDLSDETQDFRFLATISREDAKIPKRGEKDFESHSTALQENTLAASRQAMHRALAFQRVHQPKGYTMATYHVETNMAYTINPKGPLFARMGHVRTVKDELLGERVDRGQLVWLLPEEALYLLERGTIDIKWPADPGMDQNATLPMSLQAAYSMFIGDGMSDDGWLTLEKYLVYASLKRTGYTVQRAPVTCEHDLPTASKYNKLGKGYSWYTGLFGLSSWMARVSGILLPFRPRPNADCALIPQVTYRSYGDIYARLAISPYFDPTQTGSCNEPQRLTSKPWQVTYFVWKPGSSTFKKSAPGPPDFRIAVIDANVSPLPTRCQLDDLMQTTPYDPPKQDNMLYQRLKHGYKNVILAVVDQGVVSYLRVAQAAFGQEILYSHPSQAPKSKRGGRQSGRGQVR